LMALIIEVTVTDWEEDAELENMADGGIPPIAEVYDEYSAGLFRYARALLGSDEDAEDAVCEVFLQLLHGAQRLERVRNLKSYLLRATRNAVYRIFRDAQRREGLARNAEWNLETQPPPVSELDLEPVMAAFAELPREQREVLALKILYDLTFREIGEISCMSQNTASSRYRYGIERLRAAAKESEHERTN